MKPEKTEQGRLIETFCCAPFQANLIAEDFMETRSMGTGRGDVLAKHMIQSFLPDEITPDEAMEIGRKLVKSFLHDDYQYVLATHIDKDHIHNHIIFCNTNMETFRSFEYQENRGGHEKERLQEISDALCREYGLNVIENPKQGKGKSHYEWDMARQNRSWKAKLKDKIDAAIMNCTGFDDFLYQLKQQDVNVVYRPENVISLKYRLEGMKRFCRSRTLGWYYEEKQIRKRIDNYQLLRTGRTTSTQKTRLYDTSAEKFQQAKGLSRWAEIQNMKEASKILNYLTEKGIATQEELEQRSILTYGQRVQLVGDLNKLQRQIETVTDTIKLVKKYKKYKPFYDAYQRATFRKKYEKEHKQELQQFSDAKSALLERFPDRKIPSLERLSQEREKLIEQRNVQNGVFRQVVAELKELDYARTTIEEYLHSQQQVQENQQKKDDELY